MPEKQKLKQLVEDIPSLRGVFVTAMPDCLLYEAWVQEGSPWSPEQVAAYFGDLVRANREGLKALGSISSDMQVTIESPEHLILLREVDRDFVCAMVFERSAALGMVRLHSRRLLERLAASLPSFEVAQRPRGVRVVEFLNRYAPDPQMVLLRASLRTGLPVEALKTPETLDDEQIAVLEETACKILGLQTLQI